MPSNSNSARRRSSRFSPVRTETESRRKRSRQIFYPGSSQMVVDLTARPEVRFLQARWEVNRWGRGKPVPMFRFRVTARPVA